MDQIKRAVYDAPSTETVAIETERKILDLSGLEALSLETPEITKPEYETVIW